MVVASNLPWLVKITWTYDFIFGTSFFWLSMADSEQIHGWIWCPFGRDRAQHFTHVPAGNMVACMTKFRDASFQAMMGLLADFFSTCFCFLFSHYIKIYKPYWTIIVLDDLAYCCWCRQFSGVLHHALWQHSALHDVRPHWVFDRHMMGGEAGDGLVRDGQVLHSYRSFFLTRCLRCMFFLGWKKYLKWCVCFGKAV